VTPNKSVVAITQNGQPVQYFMIGTPVSLSTLSLTTSEQRETDSDGVTVEKIDDDGGSEPTLAIECKEEAKSEDEMVNVAMNEVFGFVSAESVEEGFKDNQQLDLELHKWAADDKMVECFMIDCNHQDSFSKIIAHLRKEHDNAYLIYRHRMMSAYAIMQKRCDVCTFQFMTQRAYDAHNKHNKCEVYKKIKIPFDMEDDMVRNKMKPKLLPIECVAESISNV